MNENKINQQQNMVKILQIVVGDNNLTHHQMNDIINGKNINRKDGNTNVALNTSVEVSTLSEENNLEETAIIKGIYAVTLKIVINVHVEYSGDNPQTAKLFDLIIDYHGKFELLNFDVNKKSEALEIYAPNVLFPYIRAFIHRITVEAGFPALMLDHIDFATKYLMKKQQEDAANTSVSGNN